MADLLKYFKQKAEDILVTVILKAIRKLVSYTGWQYIYIKLFISIIHMLDFNLHILSICTNVSQICHNLIDIGKAGFH